MGTTRIASYRLRIMGPDVSGEPNVDLAERGIEVEVAELDLGKIEQIINDMLPEDWYCKIED